MSYIIFITFIQGGDGHSDVLPTDPRPGAEDDRLRLQVSAGQEPWIRDSDGICRSPRTVRCHHSLLRSGLLRDT